MKKFVNWLVISSADPSKVSATFTGILIQYAGVILFAAAHLHIPITDTQLGIYTQDASIGIGALLTVFGLLRKAYIAIRDSVKDNSDPVL